MGGTMKILISVVAIAGSAGYLLAATLREGDALTYFHTVDEVIVKPADFQGQRIRLGGHVQPGSILQKKGTLEYRFDVRPVEGMLKHAEARGKTVAVTFTGVAPDTFKDDAEVVVTGKLQADGTFAASELIAKCPSKYEAAEKNRGTY